MVASSPSAQTGNEELRKLRIQIVLCMYVYSYATYKWLHVCAKAELATGVQFLINNHFNKEDISTLIKY